MRTYTLKTARPEQQRVWTRDGRPVCDICACGRVGHVRQNCFSRTDQRNQSSGAQPTPQPPPRIAVIDVKPSEGPVLTQFNHPSSLCSPSLPAMENATLTGQSSTATQLPDCSKIDCTSIFNIWIVQNVPSPKPHLTQFYVTASKVPTRLLLLQTQQAQTDQFPHDKQVTVPFLKWRSVWSRPGHHPPTKRSIASW